MLNSQQKLQHQFQQHQNQKNQIDKLSREKCEFISNLNYLKQKIQEIEMRQNEAIRDVSFFLVFFSIFVIYL